MLALCCGLSAVREAQRGEFGSSLVLLFLSMICDGLDGHVARYLNATTVFGGELDSLCDLVDFGAAPSLILYLFATTHLPSTPFRDNVIWGACLVFVVGSAYRLARFNVGTLLKPNPHPQHTYAAMRTEAVEIPGPSFRNYYLSRSKFFKGIPTPQGALMVLLPVVLHGAAHSPHSLFHGVALLASSHFTSLHSLCAVPLFIAFLEVSRVPALSGKVLSRDPRTESHFRSRSKFTLLLKIVIVSCGVVFGYRHPWDMLLLSEACLYLSVPLSPILYYRFAQADHKKPRNSKNE